MDNVTLLALYKQEKAEQEFPSAPFPSFKEWKAEYMVEYNDAHGDSEMVDAETAVEMTEKELEAEEKKTATTTVKPAKVVKIKPIKKPTTKKTESIKKVSKKAQAVDIYKSMMVNGEHPARKDVIARFVSEVGMSSAGASTYQFNIKKELS